MLGQHLNPYTWRKGKRLQRNGNISAGKNLIFRTKIYVISLKLYTAKRKMYHKLWHCRVSISTTIVYSFSLSFRSFIALAFLFCFSSFRFCIAQPAQLPTSSPNFIHRILVCQVSFARALVFIRRCSITIQIYPWDNRELFRAKCENKFVEQAKITTLEIKFLIRLASVCVNLHAWI